MKCLIIAHSRIIGNFDGIDDLSKLPDEEFFVADMDALLRGKFNFKIYSLISRYVEFNLMAYPSMETDFVDMIIAGASRVVVNHTLSSEKIRDFMEVSDQLIMHYRSQLEARDFIKNGGKYLLGCSPVDVAKGIQIFYYGMSIPGENYVPLTDFPEELRYDC